MNMQFIECETDSAVAVDIFKGLPSGLKHNRFGLNRMFYADIDIINGGYTVKAFIYGIRMLAFEVQ